MGLEMGVQLICQLPGLLIQGTVLTSVGLLFGLAWFPKFGVKSWFIVVVYAKCFGLYTRVLTKTDVRCHSVGQFVDIHHCSFKAALQPSLLQALQISTFAFRLG